MLEAEPQSQVSSQTGGGDKSLQYETFPHTQDCVSAAVGAL